MWIPQEITLILQNVLFAKAVSTAQTCFATSPIALATTVAMEVCILACSLVPDLALESCAGGVHDSAEFLTLWQSLLQHICVYKSRL